MCSPNIGLQVFLVSLSVRFRFYLLFCVDVRFFACLAVRFLVRRCRAFLRPRPSQRRHTSACLFAFVAVLVRAYLAALLPQRFPSAYLFSLQISVQVSSRITFLVLWPGLRFGSVQVLVAYSFNAVNVFLVWPYSSAAVQYFFFSCRC